VTSLHRHSTCTARKRRLRADLTLLAVAAIWGSAFVVQRLAAVEVGVYLFNACAFCGSAGPGPFGNFSPAHRSRDAGMSLKSLPGVVLRGLALGRRGCAQQAGLKYTTAGNAGFITGLYVVFIPIFLGLFWRQHVQRITWLGLCWL